MDTQRTRRLLLVAFALSLLIHVLVAAGVRWRSGTLEQSVERVTIVHRMRIAHVQPPPHTPVPPQPRRVPSNVPKSHSTRVGNRGVQTVALAQPTATPTPAPTPAASATPNCSNQDTSAAMVASPPPPDIPANARGDATNGTTHVRVELDNRGVVTGATVTTSSGNPSLDLVAETLARAAQYSPAMHQCKAVASSYDFTARFIPW